MTRHRFLDCRVIQNRFQVQQVDACIIQTTNRFNLEHGRVQSPQSDNAQQLETNGN